MLQTRRALHELATLLVPVNCPGCGQLDTKWCDACASAFGQPRRVEHTIARLDRLDGVPPLPVWVIADYCGPARELILAWKDRGRADLDVLLASKAKTAAMSLRMVLEPAGPLLVVPAPSRLSSRCERGRDHLLTAARATASGLGAQMTPLLIKRGRDQKGLDRRARGAVGVKVQMRMLARACARSAASNPLRVLLFDDVVTTGATLAAAESALFVHGVEVVGALVLAATPAPRAK